jgi:hypothetical protein
MEDKLRRYVDGLFARTVPTKKAVELKEEMIQNLDDKYNDLLAEGKTPEAAYNIAVAGIGDVSGLLSELEADDMYEEPNIAEYEAARRKSAMLTAIAVMMYILSFLPAAILSMFDSRFDVIIGIPVMLIVIAGATGLLVYNNMTKPKFRKGSATMVDEFREWQSGSTDRKSLRRAISGALWSIIVALYFIISFLTSAWQVTWILFLIGAAIEAVLNIFFALKNK